MIRIALITLFGLALRAGVMLKQGAAWFDEAFSLHFAAKPLAELLPFLPYDVHPPLHLLLLNGWMRLFGDSVASGRVLSLLFGTLAIPAVAWMTKPVFGRRASLLAAAFMAASPVMLFHSAEVRMYPLLVFFTALAAGAMVRYLDDESGKGHALLIWAAASFLAMMTHLTAVIPFFVGAAFAWGAARRRKEIRRWAAAALAAFLPFLAWAGVFVLIRMGNVGKEWQMTSALIDASVLARFTDFFLWNTDRWLRTLGAGFLVAGAAAAALRWRGAGKELCLRFSEDRRVWFLVISAALPFLLFLPVTLNSTKYLFAGLPAAMALVAGGLVHIFGGRRTGLIIGVYLLLVAVPVGSLFTLKRFYADEAAAFIEARERPGDVIWSAWFINDLSLGRYYDGDLPRSGSYPYDRSLNYDQRIIRHAGQVWTDDEVIEDLENFVAGADRVFLVTGDLSVDAHHPVERWFFEHGWVLLESFETEGFATAVLLLEAPE